MKSVAVMLMLLASASSLNMMAVNRGPKKAAPAKKAGGLFARKAAPAPAKKAAPAKAAPKFKAPKFGGGGSTYEKPAGRYVSILPSFLLKTYGQSETGMPNMEALREAGYTGGWGLKPPKKIRVVNP